jgi:flavin-dependent dehydrogenase
VPSLLPLRSFDVVVVGAGPAGSATARRLALCGWRVAVLERTRFDGPRIGESLAPSVQGLLRDLGVWQEFGALAPLPSWGTCSIWGDATPQSHSHLVSLYGCGWHVDRQAFDRMLTRAAVDAGSCLCEGVRLQQATYQDGHWRLHVADAGRPEHSEQLLDAGVLIDATGRTARIGRALGGRRLLLDRLVGVATEWVGVDVAQRGHLLVETSPDGWWYSAPLPSSTDAPSHRMMVMLMTDADLCAQRHLSRSERWLASLHASPMTLERLVGARSTSPPRVYSAVSQRLQRDPARDAGPWLAVGDAALAVDPVSGSGVLRALRTAQSAAETTRGILRDPAAWRSRVATYEAERDEECTRYLYERAEYYAAERRFPTTFWRRRHVLDCRS